MLTRVSFRKGRERQPRLSTPYVPGKRSLRYWTEAEIAVLEKHYETRGPVHCLSLLPNKSMAKVYAQASKLRLREPAAGGERTRIGTQFDVAILEAWPTLAGRGAVSGLADKLGIKRSAVSQRALALGLTLPHRKEPPWTSAEEDLLRKAPLHNPDRASALFAAHGFRRSPAAIMVRSKRLNISRRFRGALSATAAAKILGVDSKTMCAWIAAGDLSAGRRGTQRLPQQGGDVWTIDHAELRRFVIDNLDRIDIRKVDKHAFVALIAGDANLVASRSESRERDGGDDNARTAA
jgi:hypothetical protein